MGAPSKSVIVTEIQRLAAANDGVPLGRERFHRATGFKESDWSGRYWSHWSDALRDAGFEPNKWNEPHPDEDLLRALALLTQELGHFPTHAERKLRRHNDADFPAANSFNRLGTRSELVARLYAYCAERDDFPDVVSILASNAEGGEAKASDEPAGITGPSATGYVYLVRSGRHYKIGRSNDAGRRFYEINLQLPERLEVVHYFETDDPVGIERYWHQRFADQRANGEWFDLSAEDVRSFKRRKSFM